MQRYRVNYGLLIGLLATLVVVGGVGYVVLKIQLERNAEQLLRRADAAQEEGDVRKAANYLYRYYRERPEELEPARKMANTFADILTQPDVEIRKDYGNAVNLMEAVVRDHGPQVPELRERLAELYMGGRRWVDALQHLDILINSDAKNEELQRRRVACLLGAKQEAKAMSYALKLVGLDKSTGVFDESAAIGASVVEVYPQLANLLVRIEGDEDLGNAVIDRMIEANPESAKALVLRAQFLIADGRSEEADADLAKALEMAPEDAQVLLVNAVRRRELEDYAAARELLQTCIEEHPTNPNSYRELAIIELIENQDLALATAHIDQGLEQVSAGPARTLLFDKARLQADSADDEGLKASIDELKEMGGLATHQLDFLEGRWLFILRDWFKAKDKFEKIRSVVSTNAEMGGPTNFLLGVCYQQLGQHELALEAFQTSLEIQPGNAKVINAVEAVRRRLAGPQAGGADELSALVIAEQEKPESAQDWEAVDEQVVEYVEQRGLKPFMLPLLRADILMRREKYAEARALVDATVEENPDNQAVARLDVLLRVRDPDEGPVAALKKFNEAVEPKFPESVAMRLLKADLLIAIDDEALSDQLIALTDDIGEWEDDRKVQLWKGLARKFAQIRDTDNRTLCLNEVARLAPGELSTLLDLFQAALAAGDQGGMKTAQDKILSVVGDKDDPTWLFAEASRLTNEAIRNGNDERQLGLANDLVDRAIGQRPNWHLLYLSRADIAYARGDRRASLEALDRAEKLGPMTAAGMVRHIALLTQSGRFSDARRVLEKTNPTIRQKLLGRQYSEVLLNVGAVDEAMETAQQVADAGAENAGALLWYGRFMRRAATSAGVSESQKKASLGKAVDALETAAALAPESAEAWLDLMTTYAASEDRQGAEDSLRRAQLSLPADQATVVQARGYELVGRFFDAENLYRTLLERRPNEFGVKRQVASFYLSDRYPRADKRLKATSLINEILSAADSPELLEATEAERTAAQPHIRWARRAAAEQLSKTNDYQSLLKAERLLAANAADGELSRADRLLMAQILAPRPEPESRLRAIQILERLQQEQDLDTRIELVLGQLYFVTGQWDACRTQMTNLIAEAPNLPSARAAYIRMLLREDDPQSLSEAARQLGKLQKLAPNAPATAELVARVFTKYGREDDAKKVLGKLLRESTSGEMYINIARLLSELGDTESAEKIYKRIAEKSETAELQYAGFIGQYQDVDRAFGLLDELRTDLEVAQIARVALGIARRRRAEIGDTLDGRVQQWLDRGLREDPESTDLLLMQAELFDMQREYDKALAIYRQLLDGGELSRRYRAVVLNNIAYLMALSSEDADTAEEAMGYVAEAIDILGPTADILDTRAVVFVAQDKPKEAIADLELSLTDNPTASKHFHLSQAHLIAGDLKKAVAAWEDALDMGLTREEVATAEREKFDNLEAKVKAIRDNGGAR